MLRPILASLAAILIAKPAAAVIILDSTYQEEGYAAAEALAAEPQFEAIFALCDGVNDGCGNASGTWIGNDAEHGYILTAAHNFQGGFGIDTWQYRSRNGKYYKAAAFVTNPEYERIVATDEANEASIGFDIAIVTLTEPVTDAGEPPTLYAGDAELGETLTYVGYGGRGSAATGQDDKEPSGALAAAAQGVIELVEPLTTSAAGGADGNAFSVFLPKEDGSVENPLGGDVTTPISKTAGLLGSGDSGGSAWIQIDSGWVIAGINGNGSGNAAYGDTSGFARVSGQIDWITGIFPGAKTAS